VLVRDFSPIVLVLAGSVGHRWKHFSVGCRITSQFVGNECERWLPLVFQDPVKEALGGSLVAVARDEDVQDVAVLVHCSPKIVPFAANRDEQFVHVPDVPKSALSPPERVGVGRSKFAAPGSNRFVRHHRDAAFGKQIFNIAKA
jgi:hypothetical protein